ncbi:hypothetical protein CaCOL14_009406 [Colletotrichum acutatum]
MPCYKDDLLSNQIATLLQSPKKSPFPSRWLNSRLLGNLLLEIISVQVKVWKFCLLATNLFFIFPPQDVTCGDEQDSVNRHPSNQNAKVEANARVQVEQDLSAAFDHMMIGPCVRPPVESWCDIGRPESGQGVRESPKR